MEQEFIIDKLTNSILNAISGDSFQTEVILLGTADIELLANDKGWNFDWIKEYRDSLASIKLMGKYFKE